MPYPHVAAHEDGIQSTHRCVGGKGPGGRGLTPETNRLKVLFPKSPPDIVEVTANDYGRLVMEAYERVGIEKPHELTSPFTTGEAKVEVEDVKGPRPAPSRKRDSEGGVENASALAPFYGQVNIPGFLRRKAAQNGVAVGSPAPHPDVGEPGPVLQSEKACKNVHLPVPVGPTGPFINLLQENDVGVVVSYGGLYSFRSVPPVETAYALVDIIGQQANPGRYDGRGMSLI